MAENKNDQVTDNPTADGEVTEQTVTAYQAAQIVNALLEEEGETDEAGEPKTIAPQMLYGYTKSGRIPSVEVKQANGKIQRRIPLSALGAWYKEYREGNVGRGGGASTKSLADQLKQTLK